MKLYTKKSIDNNLLKDYNKIERKQTFLISNEGIFKFFENNQQLKKLIIKNDNVETIQENGIDLYLDKSSVEYKDYNKIPYSYNKIEYNEDVFIINDNMSIVKVNDTIWYIEFNNIGYLSKALSIIM